MLFGARGKAQCRKTTGRPIIVCLVWFFSNRSDADDDSIIGDDGIDDLALNLLRRAVVCS